jgi:hypothetical protein
VQQDQDGNEIPHEHVTGFPLVAYRNDPLILFRFPLSLLVACCLLSSTLVEFGSWFGQVVCGVEGEEQIFTSKVW